MTCLPTIRKSDDGAPDTVRHLDAVHDVLLFASVVAPAKPRDALSGLHNHHLTVSPNNSATVTNAESFASSARSFRTLAAVPSKIAQHSQSPSLDM